MVEPNQWYDWGVFTACAEVVLGVQEVWLEEEVPYVQQSKGEVSDEFVVEDTENIQGFRTFKPNLLNPSCWSGLSVFRKTRGGVVQ